MAIVQNVDPQRRPLTLSTGRVLEHGDEANVDTSLQPQADFIERKLLKVVDPDADPPTAEDPYASGQYPFYAHEQQPIGMPEGALWLDLATGELNRLVPED